METMAMKGQQQFANLAVAVELERFLNGESDGALLFHVLYGGVGDEPVPQHLLDIVRDGCEPAIEPETLPVVAPGAAPRAVNS
ncbi:MAG TPA: hypothetical protein VE397_16495 [Stellaceae bacterium]|jgi:hypothetical protein|nr:hypothetical protein [Stellaceae bacterium]